MLLWVKEKAGDGIIDFKSERNVHGRYKYLVGNQETMRYR